MTVSRWARAGNRGVSASAPDGAHIALFTGESPREIWAIDSYLPALNTSR